MKKYKVGLIFGFVLIFVAFSKNGFSQSTSDLEMVHYEKECQSFKESFTIKNKSNYDIKGFKIRLIYKDGNGDEITYNDYDINKTIPSGLSKKIDVTCTELQKFKYKYSEDNLWGNSCKLFTIEYTILKVYTY